MPHIPSQPRRKFYVPHDKLWSDHAQKVPQTLEEIVFNFKKEPEVKLKMKDLVSFEEKARRNVNCLSAMDNFIFTLNCLLSKQNELLEKQSKRYKKSTTIQEMCEIGNNSVQMLESITRCFSDVTCYLIPTCALYSVIRRDTYLKDLDRYVSRQTKNKLRASSLTSDFLFEQEVIKEAKKEIETAKLQRGRTGNYNKHAQTRKSESRKKQSSYPQKSRSEQTSSSSKSSSFKRSSYGYKGKNFNPNFNKGNKKGNFRSQHK